MSIEAIQVGTAHQAIIDAESLHREFTHHFRDGSITVAVDRLRWHAKAGRNGVYAMARRGERSIYLHRLITEAPVGLLVDHRNGNPLDNRMVNLRLANHSMNAANQTRRAPRQVPYRGIALNKSTGKWVAVIGVAGKSRFLGTFATPAEAARAYDAAAREAFGEFANCNFEEMPAQC